MPKQDIIVIGASSGGLEGIIKIVSSLPAGFPAAVFIVVHIPANQKSLLPEILSIKGQLPAAHPTNGEVITPGQVYIAPPDYHMIIRNGYIELSHGPKENFSRPAINPLFKSAARVYGSQTIGVILSGVLDDGAMGMMVIKSHGGTGIVQNPEETFYSQMPLAAMDYSNVDYILPVADIATTLISLVGEGQPQTQKEETSAMQRHHQQVPGDLEGIQTAIKADFTTQELDQNDDRLTMYTCPDCGGTLWQIREGQAIGFRCHVGHLWSPELMLVQKSEKLEEALWSFIRLAKENATLKRQVARRAESNGQRAVAEKLYGEAATDEANIQIVRENLLNIPTAPTSPTPTPDEEIAS